MKVLFSSTKLYQDIGQAIANMSTTFDIIPGRSEIIYFGLKEIHGQAVPTEGYSDAECYYGHFDMVKMNKLREFLKLIPEQPIVIEFTNYAGKGKGNTQLDITLSQFVMKF